MHKTLHYKNVLKLFCLTIILCFSYVSSAHAEKKDIFDRFKKSMPEIPLIEQGEFIAQTRPVKDVPYNQDALGYTLRIPKDWLDTESKSSSNFMLSEKLFLELNSFYGPASPFGRSRIEIQALSLESNLTIEQWYLAYILEAGMTPEGFVTHSADKVESLMVVMEKDYSYYLRTLVVRNENKIIMLRYYVPVGFMQEEAAMQASVVNSFGILKEIPKSPMKSEIYRFLDVAELRYGTQWKVFAAPMRSVDYLDATLVNLENGGSGKVSTNSPSQGKIDVSLILISDEKTLVEEIMEYKKKMELNGVLVGEKYIGYGEMVYNEKMDFGISEVYKGIDSRNNQSEYEFWFTVLIGGNYYYFMMLLTPSRNDNFAVWASNVQNFRFMIENFKPMSGAYLERN